MVDFPISVRQYPWVKGFDSVNERGQKKSDGQITDRDIDAWLEKEGIADSTALTREAKRDIFLIEQTSMELRFRLMLLSQKLFPEHSRELKFIGEGTILQEFKSRFESIRKQSRISNSRIEKEERDLSQIGEAFSLHSDHHGLFGGGIGIAFERKGNRVFVRNLIKNGPAHQAGLKIGDEITKVGGYGFRTEDLPLKYQSAFSYAPPWKGLNSPFEIGALGLYDIEQEQGGQEGMDLADQIVQGILLGSPGSTIILIVKRRGNELAFKFNRDFNTFPMFFSPQDTLFPLHYPNGNQEFPSLLPSGI